MKVEKALIDSGQHDEENNENSRFDIRGCLEQALGQHTDESERDIDIDEDIDELPTAEYETEHETHPDKKQEERQISGDIFRQIKSGKKIDDSRHSMIIQTKPPVNETNAPGTVR